MPYSPEVRRVLICSKMRSISEPMDGGKFVELKFDIPCCGEIAGGGEIRLRVPAEDRVKWEKEINATCFNHMRFV